VRALRSLNPQVKIVAATGTLNQAELVTAQYGHSLPILKKPYSQRKLLSTVHAMIHGPNGLS
jgi:hypothetical protein